MGRFETATPPPELSLFDAIDAPSNNATGDGEVTIRSGRLASFPVDSASILSSLIGVPAVATPFQGRRWYTVTSTAGGANFARHATNARVGTWPVGADLSLVPPSAQFPTRYEFSVNVHRGAPVLDVPFGLQLDVSPNTFVLLSQSTTAAVGVSIESRAAVNGGNWTVRRRLSAGAGLLLTDTGIVPAGVVQRLGIRYEHRAGNPQLTVLIDGVAVATFVGLANVPDHSTATGSAVQHLGVMQQNPGLVAGQVDRWVQSRATIDRLPGFPLL